MSFLKRTVAKRLSGDRPSAVGAAAASVLVGVAVAMLTYKTLRS